MFSSSRRALVPLFVYLSLLVAFAEGHESLHLRDHANLNMKRLMKKRSPFPDSADSVPVVVVGAGAIPSLSSTASVSATSASVSASASSSSVSQSASSSAVSSSSVVSSTSASSSSSVSASSSASVSASATTSASTTAAPSSTQKVEETLNLTDAQVASTSTVVPTVTRTESVGTASDTASSAPLSAAATNDGAKSTTLTVLIAVAASVGGVAILWTIFRKWKLSSSKKFDQRLNPIDWQPTTGDDDIIPTHRRVPSTGGSSYHSGSGHGHFNAARGIADLPEHDFTALPGTTSAPIGGYADLSRGPSPPMQQLARGPSVGRGYDHAVPIHNQAGYGDAYDYNGEKPRY